MSNSKTQKNFIQSQTKKSCPLVSVIIATRNEENNIERIIKSLLEQTYSNYEIIVVDNNSSDNTLAIASKYKEVQLLPLKIEDKDIKNYRGYQVNYAVDKSHGEIIFFPDADMTFAKNLLDEAVEKINNSYDALFVPEIVMGKGYFGKIRNFERSFYNETCIDGVRFVKKDIYEKIKGFDVTNIIFGPDDWDLTKTLKRKSYNIGITSEPLYHHEEWLDLNTYLRKKSKYIATFDAYVKKWGSNDPDIKKQLGLKYRYFGVFFENFKWKKLLAHPFLSLTMYILKGCIGIIFITNRLFTK